MIRLIFAIVLLIASVSAQGCPDTSTHTVPTDITTGPMINCDSTQIVIDGVRIGGSTTGCPTVIVVTPAHLEPRILPGCGTRAVPDGTVEITTLFFECQTTHIWFVRISSECVRVGHQATGRIATYTTIPCTTVAAVGASDGS